MTEPVRPLTPQEIADMNVEMSLFVQPEWRVRSLLATVAALQRDIHAYRGSLGYAVPGDHNGLLSDGTNPNNGIAEALHNQVAALQAELDAMKLAYRHGTPFDPTGAK